MKHVYLKSAYKANSFDLSKGIKIPLLRISVTIEPDRSLLTVSYHELFDLRIGGLRQTFTTNF